MTGRMLQVVSDSRDSAWMDNGLCTTGDPERFHKTLGNAAAAKAVCAACPVTQECLEYALDHRPQLLGIWAGTSEKTRRALRRERNAA